MLLCQVLYYQYGYEKYGVSLGYTPIKCKLTPCKREDLKVGDLAFNSPDEYPDFRYLVGYCIILEDREDIHISNKSLFITSNLQWNYWWKVEEV